MPMEPAQIYYFLTRYGFDLFLILLIFGHKQGLYNLNIFKPRYRLRKKKRSLKKSYKKYKPLIKFLLLAIILINVIIPVGIGSFYPRAKYFPQYMEAQKLRAYYFPLTFLPLATPNDQTIQKQITLVAKEYTMNPALIRAIVMTESSGDQFALSPTGGCGLMQIMPNTYFSLQAGNPFAVKSNLRAGTKYLRQLYRRFDGNLDLVLAAYNAGPNAVARHGGIPPYAETRRYVVKVKKLYALYRNGE